MKLTSLGNVFKKVLVIGACSLTLFAGAVVTIHSMMPTATLTASGDEITPDRHDCEDNGREQKFH